MLQIDTGSFHNILGARGNTMLERSRLFVVLTMLVLASMVLVAVNWKVATKIFPWSVMDNGTRDYASLVAIG